MIHKYSVKSQQAEGVKVVEEKERERQESLRERLLRLVMLSVLLLSMTMAARGVAQLTMGQAVTNREVTVVIDAGHGGSDPGKVGINGALEKDINLEVAKQVRDFLETEGIHVVMTRENTAGLYDQESSNAKLDDMRKRIAIIEQEKPDVVVSIHQNSYPQEEVNGPQVFYYKDSLEGKRMAEQMQKQLIRGIKPKKERVEKENGSYYLLKKTSVPIVIVECGFLSNREEAEKLCDPAYREKVAWNIHLAILQYLNGKSLF